MKCTSIRYYTFIYFWTNYVGTILYFSPPSFVHNSELFQPMKIKNQNYTEHQECAYRFVNIKEHNHISFFQTIREEVREE